MRLQRLLGALCLGLALSLAVPAALRAGEVIVDVFVDVPAVIAVDVTGDLVFDLSRLPGPKAPNDCENVYPPGSACEWVTYDPTGGRSISVAVFDNSPSGSVILSERVAGAWTRSLGSRVATSDLHVRASDAEAGGPKALSAANEEVARSAPGGRWVRYSRSLKLVTRASTLVQTPREGMQTTVTYALSRTQ